MPQEEALMSINELQPTAPPLQLLLSLIATPF